MFESDGSGASPDFPSMQPAGRAATSTSNGGRITFEQLAVLALAWMEPVLGLDSYPFPTKWVGVPLGFPLNQH